MAGRVQHLARLIVEAYDGVPEHVWTTAGSGAELLKQVAALPGFGAQKAQIFVALLGKQLGVRPDGWREAAGTFGADGSHLSVADITDDESLAKVRSYKASLQGGRQGQGGREVTQILPLPRPRRVRGHGSCGSL